ncbi:MAG: hypothetical protein WDW38_006895 [Sanguina aurantia]
MFMNPFCSLQFVPLAVLFIVVTGIIVLTGKHQLYEALSASSTMASSALVQIPVLGPALGSYLLPPVGAKTPKKAMAQPDITLPEAAGGAIPALTTTPALTLSKPSELHIRDSTKQDRQADAPAAVSAPSTAPGPALIVEVVDKGGNKMLILDEPMPEDCYAEQHADYGGDAVMWGLGNKVRSAAECCKQCKEFKPHNRDSLDTCNIWVWCGDPSGVCWTMDIHAHTTGGGWRIELDAVVNHRGRFSPEFRREHVTSPELVPWVAGVIPRSSSSQ